MRYGPYNLWKSSSTSGLQVAAVRAGVKLGKQAEWRKEEVRAEKASGFKVVVQAAFVQLHVFTKLGDGSAW